ncbi:MAG: hypothetical protein RMJ07_02940 [Nitrososphaerota archaeon]|nr:hypothetical protein [Candidatus Bathyarchaeota archaeon]MDW8048621.1 hypothetical protein [Nitrososphaerota archaeon]
MSTWNMQPLYSAILNILKQKGSLTDEELFDMLKDSCENIGFGEFNKALMRLEVTGLVSVSSLAKDRRIIQLLKNNNR